MGAAIFLYGFSLIYGGTGTTDFAGIRAVLAEQARGGGINSVALLGVVLAFLGVCFKIAAVPMHFYTPDVYQGAAAPVSAFLAFVPKSAGFFAIMLLCACVGWNHTGGTAPSIVGHSLPEPLRLVIWIVAVCTMTAGNVLAILQNSVKRLLAYSSIAHSGYMLVGIVAGPGKSGDPFTNNGLAAVLFYLLAYGVMNLGAFAVLACLERRGRDGAPEEIDSFADIRGLCQSRPLLGWTLVLCSMSLLGLPPLLGFFGKVPLFTAGIAAHEYPLVIILGVNSAIAAYYYLRLAYAAYLEDPDASPQPGAVTPVPFVSRRIAGALSAAGVIVLAAVGGWLASAASDGASEVRPSEVTAHAGAPDHALLSETGH
jgi:NADH-quinone oxidoreductase subunit N